MKVSQQIRLRTWLGASCVLIVAGTALADWRDWTHWPDFLSAGYTKFDRFQIAGDAPFCFLNESSAEYVECHYLSEEHCLRSNYLFISDGDPDERGLCVSNPLK